MLEIFFTFYKWVLKIGKFMILLIFIYLSTIKLRLIGYPLQIFNCVNKLASIKKRGG